MKIDIIDFLVDIICLPLDIASRLKEHNEPKILRILCLLWYVVWFFPLLLLFLPLLVLGLLIDTYKEI